MKMWEELEETERQEIQKLLADKSASGQVEEFLDEVYDEVPVSMEQLLDDDRYLGSMKKALWPMVRKLLIHGAQPHLRELWLEMGKGSGKSMAAAIFLYRGIYELSCFKDWKTFFGVTLGEGVILNLSTSKIQARGVIFGYLGQLLKSSPWFINKFQEKTIEIRLQNDIVAYCGHSGSAAWEGFNVYYGVIDEVDKMKNPKTGRSNAARLYELVLGQSRPRFPGWYKVINISSMGEDEESFIDGHVEAVAAKGREVQI